MLAVLLAAQLLVPGSAPIGTARQRVRDPVRERAPAAVLRGYRLFEKSPRKYAGAALSCGNCHLNAGQKEGALPLVGIASVFPEYNKRSGRDFTLEDRIVGCFLRSLNSPGRRGSRADAHENAHPDPAPDAPEVQAIAAYLRWLSDGVPAEQTRAWRGARVEPIALEKLDPRRGHKLYLEKCAACHGKAGQGLRIGELRAGPLWGPRSWNDGAGAARTYTLASYLRHAMPYTAPGSLSDEEAQEIAAFLTAQPRPEFPAKALDFLKEPLPTDAVYYRRP